VLRRDEHPLDLHRPLAAVLVELVADGDLGLAVGRRYGRTSPSALRRAPRQTVGEHDRPAASARRSRWRRSRTSSPGHPRPHCPAGRFPVLLSYERSTPCAMSGDARRSRRRRRTSRRRSRTRAREPISRTFRRTSRHAPRKHTAQPWCTRMTTCGCGQARGAGGASRSGEIDLTRCRTRCFGMDPSLESIPRAGIIHRLDKDTSGLLVVREPRKRIPL